MKRSEMIQKIKLMLDGLPIEPNYADQFLTVVEKLGMKPPAVDWCSECGNYNNYWEDEDDSR